MFKRLRGYRTLCVFSPIFLLALLDALKTVDLTPLFVTLHVAEPDRSTILCLMSVLAITLRVYTSTPVGRDRHDDELR